MARPTKYCEEVQNLADEYLETYGELGDVVPSIEGLADFTEISRKTLQLWSADESKPKFLRTFEAIKNRQARKLINGGLSNAFNPAITKLMLHNFGYTDKVSNEISNPDGSLSKDLNITVVAPEKE